MNNENSTIAQSKAALTGKEQKETLLDNAPTGNHVLLALDISEMMICAGAQRGFDQSDMNSSFRQKQVKRSGVSNKPVWAEVFYENKPNKIIHEDLHDNPFGEATNDPINKIVFSEGSCGEINFSSIGRYSNKTNSNRNQFDEKSNNSYSDLKAISDDKLLVRESIIAGQKALYSNLNNIAYAVSYFSLGDRNGRGNTPHVYNQLAYSGWNYTQLKANFDDGGSFLGDDKLFGSGKLKDEFIIGGTKYGIELSKAALKMNKDIVEAVYTKSKAVDTLSNLVKLAKEDGVMYSAAYLPKIFSFSAPQGKAWREILDSAKKVNLVSQCKEIEESSSWFSWGDKDEAQTCGDSGKEAATRFISHINKMSLKNLEAQYELIFAGNQSDLYPFKSDKRDITNVDLPEDQLNLLQYFSSIRSTKILTPSFNEGVSIDTDQMIHSSLTGTYSVLGLNINRQVVNSIQPANTIDNPLVNSFKLNPFFYTSQLGEELIQSGINLTTQAIYYSSVIGLLSDIPFAGAAAAYVWNYVDGLILAMSSLLMFQGALMKFGTSYLLFFALFMMTARWLFRAVVGIIISNWVVIALMMPR